MQNEQPLNAKAHMNRYAIYEGSESGHCCFDATVVDTQKPINSSGQLHYEPVCECFSKDDAEMICKALNAMDDQQEPATNPASPSQSIIDLQPARNG